MGEPCLLLHFIFSTMRLFAWAAALLTVLPSLAFAADFFYNDVTGKSQWEEPEHPVAYEDEKGQKYWYDSSKDESSWEVRTRSIQPRRAPCATKTLAETPMVGSSDTRYGADALHPKARRVHTSIPTPHRAFYVRLLLAGRCNRGSWPGSDLPRTEVAAQAIAG